jgi:hypothetical protein
MRARAAGFGHADLCVPVLFVERDSELCALTCRCCRAPVRPGERVLVAYRSGKPQVIHAHLCEPQSASPNSHEAVHRGRT